MEPSAETRGADDRRGRRASPSCCSRTSSSTRRRRSISASSSRFPIIRDALHYAGVLAHQQGRSDEAVALIEKSLALAPDRADCYSNLGIIYKSMRQARGGRSAPVERAIAIDPGHANAHSNLGVLLRATGHPAEAEAAYRTAIRLDPQHIDAYTNLGILLNGLKRTEEAAACFSQVITLRPKHKEARQLLALAHCALGEIDRGGRHLRGMAATRSRTIRSRGTCIAACTGRDVPARASNGFVERTFDSFAASFESKLERLSYRAPALVAAMIEEAGVERAKQLDVLDAGCGTGLCGPLLAPYARRLVGVDLSEGMLARAKEKQRLRRARAVRADAVPRRQPRGVRSDRRRPTRSSTSATWTPVVAAAAGALRPSGLLIFTLEHAVRAAEGVDYRLEFHGRYSSLRGPTSSGSSPPQGCARTSPKPTCAWSRACRWPAWWFERRKHEWLSGGRS